MGDDLENHESGDHGELFPKLKMENQELVGVDENRSRNLDGLSICQFCNKGFRSIKALGGHLRTHYQSQPELRKSANPTKKRKREDIISLHDIAKKINISKRNKATTGTVPTCFICSKTFPSMKSLFGHMRCHPERDWRGIHPPPPPINKATTSYSSLSSSSMVLSDDDDDDDRVSNFSAAPVDLTKSLSGWSTTAKRGRKLQASSEFDREILAAHVLIRLANGDGGDLFRESRSSPSPTLTPTVVEATNSNSLAYKAVDDSENKKKKKKISFQELSAGYIKKFHHPVKQLSFRPVDDRKPENKTAHDDDDDDDNESGKSVSSRSQWEDTSNWAYEEDESASRNTEQQQIKGNGKVITVKNNIKKRRKKIKDLESVQDASPNPVHVHQVVPATTPPPPDKYRCGTCNKSFQTYQALGGHRSVHNKLTRTTIHNFVVKEEEEEVLVDSLVFEDEENKESDEGAGSSKQVDDETITTTTTTIIHKCSSKFSTGRAPVAVAPSSLEVSTSVGELSHTCGGRGRVLDFDLNEAPPAEDDDDDDGGLKCDEHDVCGHASSSFNSLEFPFFESSSSGL